MGKTNRAILDSLDRAGLLALRAEVDARLAALEVDLGATEATQDGDTAPKRNGGSSEAGSKRGRSSRSRRGGGRWVELKRINGCGPYAYERWFEGGVKKSRYIGKAVAGGGR